MKVENSFAQSWPIANPPNISKNMPEINICSLYFLPVCSIACVLCISIPRVFLNDSATEYNDSFCHITLRIDKDYELIYKRRMNREIILKAVELGGGQTKLGKKLGLTQGGIHQWIRREQIPAKWVLAVEAATGGEVTRYELRPDIFLASPNPDTLTNNDDDPEVDRAA